ncbi:hypothetical protein H9Q70_000692 [Fusarium xylarioides]|nr:hypothetical protein H9Q70_000692 [Fusarium xylarioides]KAG5818408.1 hypothetical protein H9Q74_010082 [Fusarium xylarioides]KAG5819843.1 hypothetical protein H9Q71_000816 [Fusarium xylarioides]
MSNTNEVKDGSWAESVNNEDDMGKILNTNLDFHHPLGGARYHWGLSGMLDPGQAHTLIHALGMDTAGEPTHASAPHMDSSAGSPGGTLTC